MTITVIDDDEEILELYCDYLETLGYTDVKPYKESGQFRDEDFLKQVILESDAILCDIRMPDLDGRQIMDRVIEMRKKLAKHVSFIFISGIPKDYYPLTPDGWGTLIKADDMVGKPISMNEIKEVLELHGIYPSDKIIDSFDKQLG